MFSSLTIRRVLTGVMAVPLLFSIQGCRDSDAIAAVGAIAIIGGAVAIGSSMNNNNHYRGRGYNNGYGYNRGYQRPPHRGYWHRSSAVVGEDYSHEEREVEELNSAALMASRYNISITAAKTLKNSLNATVEGQTLQPIYELGLSKDDLQSLSQAKGVSAAAIQNLSAKLNLTQSQAEAMVQQMTTDVLNSKNIQAEVSSL